METDFITLFKNSKLFKLKSGDIIRIYSSIQKRYYDVLICWEADGYYTIMFSDLMIEDTSDLGNYKKL